MQASEHLQNKSYSAAGYFWRDIVQPLSCNTSQYIIQLYIHTYGELSLMTWWTQAGTERQCGWGLQYSHWAGWAPSPGVQTVYDWKLLYTFYMVWTGSTVKKTGCPVTRSSMLEARFPLHRQSVKNFRLSVVAMSTKIATTFVTVRHSKLITWQSNSFTAVSLSMG